MRGLLLAVITGLMVASALAPTVSAASEDATVPLYAHWPADLATAMEEPIPLTTLYPMGEPDLSAGPATPGATAADTVPTFTYRLINPDGSDGPYGDLELDPTRPLVVDFYLSADQAPWPAAAGAPPEDVDAGAAPEMTLEATLKIGGEEVAHAVQTQTLVTAPEPAGAPVQRYVLELPFEATVLQRGEGLTVDLTVRQVDQEGQMVTQPGFNVHTGEDHPTHVQLPVANDEALTHGAPADEGDPRLDVSSFRADSEQERTVAVGVLMTSVVVAAVAAARMLPFWD